MLNESLWRDRYKTKKERESKREEHIKSLR